MILRGGLFQSDPDERDNEPTSPQVMFQRDDPDSSRRLSITQHDDTLDVLYLDEHNDGTSITIRGDTARELFSLLRRFLT